MQIEIMSHLVKLAAYYEKTLTDEQVEIYSNQIMESLTSDECAHACKLYINDPKNEFFPRPVSKLITLIKSPISNEDISQNISSMLIEAEKRFGPHWDEGCCQEGQMIFRGKDCAYTNWRHAALSVFGEVGLKVVDRYGGWKDFCINIYESPDGVIRAQIKNLATSLQNTIQKTGSFDYLPTREPPKGLTSTGDIMKFLRNAQENDEEK